MLKQRVLTAIVLVAALLAGLFLLPQVGWVVLVTLVAAGAAWEWAGMNRFDAWRRPAFTLLAVMVFLALSFAGGLASDEPATHGVILAAYGMSALFWIVFVPNWLRRRWSIDRGVGVVVGLVVIVPPALALAHLRQFDPFLPLAAMSLVWVADIAAYFSGRSFGRHKLAPTISPGKTWEGAGGAVIGVLAFGLAMWFVFRPEALATYSALLVTVFLVVLTAVSIEGDLFESMLKRQAGIKDSGSILPGHGGILDRIDSLTSTLPLVGLMVFWVARYS